MKNRRSVCYLEWYRAFTGSDVPDGGFSLKFEHIFATRE